MGGVRGSRLGGLVLSAVTGLAVLSGCQSVEFRMPSRADDGGSAVLGLGGATPYLRDVPVRTSPAADPPALLDVYAATGPGMLSPVVRSLPTRLYLPSGAGIDVFDPGSYRRVGRIKLAARSVTASWDLRTLWAETDDGLVPFDPRTGRQGRRVPVRSPGGLYFTPDGREALVLSRGGRGSVEIRDPASMKPLGSLTLPCRTVDHLDFSADGGTALASCTASGRLVALTTAGRRVTGSLDLPRAHPQQVMLSPDGSLFFVSDPVRGGVWMVDSRSARPMGFLPTGRGASDLVVSRDGSTLYVADRGDGTVVSVSFATHRTTAAWTVPGRRIGAVAGLSPDGASLWLTIGRAVYALSTVDGRPLHAAPFRVTGTGQQAPCLFPLPGLHSLGATMR